MSANEEEQELELEALASIYPDELTITDPDPPASFEIDVYSEFYLQDPDSGCCALLKFVLNPDYPSTSIPEIDVISGCKLLTEEDTDQLKLQLEQEAGESLGMAMVFTLVTSLQDKLNNMLDEIKERKSEEEQRKFKEEEAENLKKLVGTPVTVETFIEWKRAFDEEMFADRAKRRAEITNTKRPTGRDQFLKDATLNLSDLKILEEAEDSMKIDESLFEDMDDLELSDDED